MNCISVDSIVRLESPSLSFSIQTAISRPNTMKNRMISLWLELGQTLFNQEEKRHRRLRSNCVENGTKASWKSDLVPKSCSVSWINLKVQHHSYMLNCKINSTNGGTFSKSAEKIFSFFFFFRGPQLCPNRPGNTKLKKKIIRKCQNSNMSQLHILGLGVGWGSCSVNAWIIHSRWVKYD